MDGPLGRNRRRKSTPARRSFRIPGLERCEERRMLHGNPLSLDFLPETAAVAPLATTPAAHFARPANAPNLFPSPMETGAPGNAPEERIPTSETTESLTVAQPIFVVAEIVQTELLDQDQGEAVADAATKFMAEKSGCYRWLFLLFA